MMWALLGVALAQAPALWVEPGVGAWRSTSCGCVDNVLGELGAGLSVSLSERVTFELHPRWQAAGYPLGAGVHMWTISVGFQVRAREDAPSPSLSAGLSRSRLNAPGTRTHRGGYMRVGLRLEPGGWWLEPGVELAALSGPAGRGTATVSLRVARPLAPAPPPR